MREVTTELHLITNRGQSADPASAYIYYQTDRLTWFDEPAEEADKLFLEGVRFTRVDGQNVEGQVLLVPVDVVEAQSFVDATFERDTNEYRKFTRALNLIAAGEQYLAFIFRY